MAELPATQHSLMVGASPLPSHLAWSATHVAAAAIAALFQQAAAGAANQGYSYD